MTRKVKKAKEIKTKNNYEKIVNKYYGYIHHFLEDNCGRPCQIYDKKLKKSICKDIPQLYIDNNDRLCKEPNMDLDVNLIAAFYKISYESVLNDYYSLGEKLTNLAENY